jgi:hypothetical protein
MPEILAKKYLASMVYDRSIASFINMAYKHDILSCMCSMLCTQVNMMFLMLVLNVYPHRAR